MERAQELFLARLNLLLFWMHGCRFSLWRSAAARFLLLCLMPLTSFIQGLATTRGLIVAIGAQNAFVLRQALDALLGLAHVGAGRRAGAACLAGRMGSPAAMK